MPIQKPVKQQIFFACEGKSFNFSDFENLKTTYVNLVEFDDTELSYKTEKYLDTNGDLNIEAY